MKSQKSKIGDLLFVVTILLLIIPQTRMPIMVLVNQVKVKLFSPDLVDNQEEYYLKPFSYKLKKLNGEATSIEVGQGDIVFISYWATWCPPCIAELPSIEALYKSYGDKVKFVMISNEEIEEIDEFLKRKGYKVPAFAPLMKTPNELYEQTIPTNYIIDATGKIVVKEKGASDWNSKKVRKILDELIRQNESLSQEKTLSIY